MIICILFFFLHDPATPDIYTLSLHDALPISKRRAGGCAALCQPIFGRRETRHEADPCREQNTRSAQLRSEEHTSELQSQSNLVCRLLLEKKKNNLFHNSLL